MSQLLPASTATPDVRSAPSAVDSTQYGPTRVLVTEQEVAFATAAAISVPPATTRHRRLGTTLIAAIGRIHIALPEPRPHYPRRDPNYFEAARMAREMDHL
ncbi:hypothetical protein [Mycobacterium sp. AZCC_0083]|uniref:hypothetical protein n=1 Tax=Mycobacterium sp. AZCC_0083 TaxID=2735882 RepID=UPI0016205D05|nr:hypothetical protein [Mycobacterium sp. AZCC_0083]MBB5166520.1 hypothetical protein [Mycobacterium sp. AZCC_0083]